ncbi:MAG: MotA/TolQ/ExbB proton channel family protein [Myxococcota bacterium]
MISLLGHVRDLWSEGGVVMPALFCTAFVLWTTLGHRLLTVRRGVRGPLRHLVGQALRDGAPRSDGVVAEALRRGAKLWRERGGSVPLPYLDESFGELEDRLRSGATLARVLVGMAPLLGLLGTVTGLIETFGSLGTSSTSAASEGIAGGIVEALYATQMGLAIAVPGLLMGGFLHHREERLQHELDELKEILGGAHREEVAT